MGCLSVRCRALLVVLAIGSTSACVRTSSPLTPSSGNGLRLAGTVSILSGGQLTGQIPGARLTIQDGANQGVQISTDSSGRYAFSSLEGGRFTMVIEASGFLSVAPIVALARDIEVDFALRKIGETP